MTEEARPRRSHEIGTHRGDRVRLPSVASQARSHGQAGPQACAGTGGVLAGAIPCVGGGILAAGVWIAGGGDSGEAESSAIENALPLPQLEDPSPGKLQNLIDNVYKGVNLPGRVGLT